MIDLEQNIQTTWNNVTKDWYISKGYEFTKIRQPLIVKAEDLMLSSTALVEVTCDFCGKTKMIHYNDYNKSTKNGTLKYACSKCNGKKYSDLYGEDIRVKQYEKFVNACKYRGYIPVSNFEDYKKSTSRMEFICPLHGLQNVEYNTFIHSISGCPQCGHILAASRLKKSTEEVIKSVECKNNNKIVNPEEYINTSTNNLKIICGSCGNEFTTSLASILLSDGRCKECGIEYQSSLMLLPKEEVEYRINSINNNILLNPDDYRGNNINNLKIQCECGNIFTTSLANYEYSQVNRCRICTQRTSKGELMIMQVLDFYKIAYIQEYRFVDCIDSRTLPFDFYLPDYNILIEFDGPQHFYPVYSIENFIRTVRHDQIKNSYCFDKNIHLIRIPYWEGNEIKEILKEELNLPEIKMIKYPLK